MSEEKEKTIGARIKKVRGSMTQQEFADLLGIGRTTVIRYEKDERTPDMDFVLKLNLLYKVQPIWLMSGAGQKLAGEKLNQQEADFLRHFRQCSAEEQKALVNLIELVAKKQPQEEKS